MESEHRVKIKAHLNQPIDQLLASLGHALHDGGFVLKYDALGKTRHKTLDSQRAKEAKSWLSINSEMIKQKICVEWEYCKKKATLKLDSRVEIIAAIAALFGGIPGQIGAGVILATILFRQRLDALCGCDKASRYLEQSFEVPEGSQQELELLKKAIEEDPYYAQAYYNIGVTYHQRGDFKLAKEYYSKAVDYNPDDWYALNNLGYLWLCDNENVNEAFDFVERAFNNNPKSDHIAHSYGLGLLRKKRFADAIPHLKFAVSASKSENRMYMLAVAYSHCNETAAALDICKEMKSLGLLEFRDQVEKFLATGASSNLEF